MRISLTVKAGPHEGQVFEFKERANFIVGRSDRAHFRLPIKDNSISRIHFMIEMNPPQCRVTDMGSTNGTKVNGRKVASTDLKDGDLITAGKTILLVSVTGSDEPTVSPTEPVLASSAQAFDFVLDPGPSDEPAAASSGPVFSTRDYPSRSRPAEKAPSSCRLCGGSLAGTEVGAGASGRLNSKVDTISLCPACQGRIGNQPQPITGYQIVRELGSGGMGVVYQALRMGDGGLVALKTIKPEVDPTPAEIDRFLREAQILSELDHPNIVSFHEFGESNRFLYFAMDYVAGTDAAQLLEQHRGPLPITRALDLVCQVLRALDYAHARGFVHLDVKPSNMLVSQEGGRDLVRLSDFGLARIYLTSKMSGLSTDTQGGGTAPFMAPEQISDLRAAKPSADQYSAAATLYNLLTDCFTYDFPKKLHAKIMKILLEDPVPIRNRRPDLPEGLTAVIHRALARDPQARYPNVRELRRALLPFAK
jgi:eukaryotic-like serine/threonine-protein kinase